MCSPQHYFCWSKQTPSREKHFWWMIASPKRVLSSQKMTWFQKKLTRRDNNPLLWSTNLANIRKLGRFAFKLSICLSNGWIEEKQGRFAFKLSMLIQWLNWGKARLFCIQIVNAYPTAVSIKSSAVLHSKFKLSMLIQWLNRGKARLFCIQIVNAYALSS